MRLSEFTLPNKTRLDITIDDHGDRLFYEAKLKPSEMNWLQKSDPNNIYAEATVDLHERRAYINRIDAHVKSNGYGTELLHFILLDLKDRGMMIVSTYIEHSNSDSKGLFRKFGFEDGDRNKDGQYYTLNL